VVVGGIFFLSRSRIVSKVTTAIIKSRLIYLSEGDPSIEFCCLGIRLPSTTWIGEESVGGDGR
jgi:hypothetical protein